MPANTHKKTTTNPPARQGKCQYQTPYNLRRVSSMNDELSFVKNSSQDNGWNSEEELTKITEAEEMQRQCFFDDSFSLSDGDSVSESNEDEDSAIPFWFSFEEPSHIERVVKAYSRYLKLNQISGPRQLPNFVGRIERHPVEDDSDEGRFTTLDYVVVCRRDKRQVGSTVTIIEDVILVTTWNEDGVPIHFSTLATTREQQSWEIKKILDSEPSFLYCIPVWHSTVDYVYQVCSKKRDIGYANEPFNFTKYIPSHYLLQTEPNT